MRLSFSSTGTPCTTPSPEALAEFTHGGRSPRHDDKRSEPTPEALAEFTHGGRSPRPDDKRPEPTPEALAMFTYGGNSGRSNPKPRKPLSPRELAEALNAWA